MAANGDKYLLAIEPAISGGSLALFHRGELIGEMAGLASVSRAEDLLPNIKEILANAGVSKHALSRIAISIGPGSYTGLRIGISTAMGLCRGLGIECVGVGLFDSILSDCDATDAIPIVPMGKADVCLVDPTAKDSPRTLSQADAIREIENEMHSKLMLHPDLQPIFVETECEIVDMGQNLAKYVGSFAAHRPPSREIRPIYIQNPRFG